MIKSIISKRIEKRLGGYKIQLNKVDFSLHEKLSQEKSVGIIGGGLAGVSAAIFLSERGFKVKIFEKEKYLGGKVGYAFFLPRGRVALRCGEISASAFGLGFALNAAAVVLFAWNAIAPTLSSPQCYVLGLMCALSIAGINFIVAVLSPKEPTT